MRLLYLDIERRRRAAEGDLAGAALCAIEQLEILGCCSFDGVSLSDFDDEEARNREALRQLKKPIFNQR